MDGNRVVIADNWSRYDWILTHLEDVLYMPRPGFSQEDGSGSLFRLESDGIHAQRPECPGRPGMAWTSRDLSPLDGVESGTPSTCLRQSSPSPPSARAFPAWSRPRPALNAPPCGWERSRGAISPAVFAEGKLIPEVTGATQGRVEILIQPGERVRRRLELSNPELEQQALDAESQLKRAEAWRISGSRKARMQRQPPPPGSSQNIWRTLRAEADAAGLVGDGYQDQPEPSRGPRDSTSAGKEKNGHLFKIAGGAIGCQEAESSNGACFMPCGGASWSP